ncbi:MAG TPA: SUMF1/EgtB/PvdO family nonheme iron enzyme [Candidatus Margulisiibacteriota bacterium]|nr:SUMF1/EgtB/PvdO family nonheme iron enzyme [Candidatus Margulisiibacteriota bacterium]
MKSFLRIMIIVSVSSWPAMSALGKCSPDSVQVGPVCVDLYEASVWSVPATNTAGNSNAGLIKKIQKGTVKLADLNAGGATLVSPAAPIPVGTQLPSCDPGAFPASFPPNGNWTSPLYAVSVAGVLPTACFTWFQAEQACALSAKRLLTNQEFQRAAAGSPDTGLDDGVTDCNISTAAAPVNTGSRSKCRSNWGTHDMVGNVNEWVADWVPLSTVLFLGWKGGFSPDGMGLADGPGAATTADGPGAITRGGSWLEGTYAGVFKIDAGFNPSDRFPFIGFRCAR